MAATV
jgi:hypothetical protein